MNWRDHETELWVAPVVVTSTQVCALRDADIAAKSHRGEIVDPTVLANPAVIRHTEMPRILDDDTWLDYDAFADSRTEKTK
jgi:hypothetical protein